MLATERATRFYLVKIVPPSLGLGAEGWPVLYGLGDTPSQKKPLFTSLHSGVVMFATADGAVRGLSFTIEQETFNRLAGMADGETL